MRRFSGIFAQEGTMKQKLEAGQIVNTHGVRGAVRIKPWCDSAEFLTQLRRFFIDGQEHAVRSSSVHKGMLLCELDGVDTLEKAIALKGKTVWLDRSDVELEDGRFFVQDLLGLKVIDEKRGSLGSLVDVLNLPASDVYLVRAEDGREWMIPVVDEFVRSINPEAGEIRVSLIEGMESK